MSNRRKMRLKDIKKVHIVYISIIIILNMIGVGYGYWSNGIKMQAIVSTGEINAVFGRVDIIFESSIKKLSWTSSNGKKLHISMEDAYPGYYAIVNYEVRNEGTIPIVCDNPEVSIKQVGNMFPLDVEVIPPLGIINGYGKSGVGKIIVRVGGENSCRMENNQIFHINQMNIQRTENCDFNMRLLYHQASENN